MPRRGYNPARQKETGTFVSQGSQLLNLITKTQMKSQSWTRRNNLYGTYLTLISTSTFNMVKSHLRPGSLNRNKPGDAIETTRHSFSKNETIFVFIASRFRAKLATFTHNSKEPRKIPTQQPINNNNNNNNEVYLHWQKRVTALQKH